ncbi:hypothetical protein RU86_GL001563 [Lactococcus piscium]|uniref:Peptidase S9 prolyl oligopeptidase catalytic domain-containing protein n=1 Tax=Pseudolactococcus piscium TaxID=1364 RepID=A0A2A5S4Z7_9LACT|nr:prolyl oligopeptidase family serine peptidase [Lactococcus piscium]PCS08538.1 hypothetical protein RU86_GL001563 [Lactococcus piscium]
MIIQKKLGIALALCATLLLAACQTNKTKEAKVTEIEASAYVSPEGQKLDKIIYHMDGDMSKLASLKPKDIDIKLTVAPNPFLGEKKDKQETAKIDKVSVSGNQLTLDIKDVDYPKVKQVAITSSNKLLTAQKKDFVLKSKTSDLFKKNTFTDSSGTVLTYWFYQPKSDKKTPLVIWEHGGGEVLASSYEGANLVANQGATTWIEHGFEAAVLSVQYPENYSFGISEIESERTKMAAFNKAKAELIKQYIDKGTVDAHRVYLTGASSGGGASLRFIQQYPDLFAGALVVCAKDTIVPISKKYDLAYKLDNKEQLLLSPENYQATYSAMETALKDYPKNVPIWFVQAEHDQVCTSYTSKMMYEILKTNGAQNNKLTLYSDQEMEAAGVKKVYHPSWQLVYQDKQMLNWLFKQKN